MRTDLLLMRFTVLNFGASILLYLGFNNGLILDILEKDHSYISVAIIILFCFGWLLTCFRVWQISRKPIPKNTFLVTAEMYTSTIQRISSTLVAMGIIGTIYGIIIALSETNLSNLTNVSTIGSELTIMVNGLMTMFVTTITGLTTAAYLGLCIQLLENGYRKVYIEKYIQDTRKNINK